MTKQYSKAAKIKCSSVSNWSTEIHIEKLLSNTFYGALKYVHQDNPIKQNKICYIKLPGPIWKQGTVSSGFSTIFMYMVTKYYNGLKLLRCIYFFLGIY